MKHQRVTLTIVLASLLLTLGVVSTTANAKTTWSYTTPKVLRGTWYYGKHKCQVKKHSFTNMPLGDWSGGTTESISNKVIVKHSHGKAVYGYKLRTYFHDIKPYGYQLDNTYVPIIFNYNHHNYKGLDIRSHGVEDIMSRKKLNYEVSLTGVNYHKVKLVHYGW